MKTITAEKNADRTATLARIAAPFALGPDAGDVVRDAFDALTDGNDGGFYGALDAAVDLDHVGDCPPARVLQALRAVAVHFARADLAIEADRAA